MVGFFFLVIFLFAGAFAVMSLSAWSLKEHELANKWRRAEYLGTPYAIPTVVNEVHGWMISYRDKGKVKTIVIEEEDESEALMKAIKDGGVGYDCILSSTRRG